MSNGGYWIAKLTETDSQTGELIRGGNTHGKETRSALADSGGLGLHGTGGLGRFGKLRVNQTRMQIVQIFNNL